MAKPCSDSYSYDWLDNPFETLQASICFDDVTNGRKGQILVAQQEGGRGVPIMRTTTSYITPAQYFQPEHATLAKLIHKIASLPAGIMFNNAMIEVYSNAYTTMGFHSDQALDLQEGSFIALFSCYKHPTQTTPLRKLVVKSKESGSREFEVPLVHNSVVVFSLDTNTHYRHKIVLDIAGSPNCPENEWMGITFRTSKTFLQFQDGQAHFEDGTVLSMAQEEQRRDLFHLRRRENEEVGFIYPPVTYTLSESDLKLPV
ncbi:hypothetical protein EON65_11085 [archaeon]|nr:MAG: hypothetical protein EON65_11085 [archaeon]